MNGTHRLAQVPPGVQCFVGEEARRRRRIEETVVHVFEGWDYEEIIPPLFDYADVFAGEALAPKTYSFVGRDGSVLALRPDFTSLLAKIAAGRLRDRPAPMRLYYSGEVVRYEPVRRAARASSTRWASSTWAARPGPPTPRSSRSPPSPSSASARAGWVLALGHVGVFGGLVEGSGLEGERLEAVRERIESKDAAGVRRALEGTGLPPATASGAGAADRDGRRARGARRGGAGLRLLPARGAGGGRAPRGGGRPAPGGARGAAWPSTSARCGASTTTPASSSASSRPTSASRSAAAGATTRSSPASGGRCPRSASCSGSTGWPSSSSGRGWPGLRCPPPRRGSTATTSARRSPTRASRRASGQRVRFGNGGAK